MNCTTHATPSVMRGRSVWQAGETYNNRAQSTSGRHREQTVLAADGLSLKRSPFANAPASSTYLNGSLIMFRRESGLSMSTRLNLPPGACVPSLPRVSEGETETEKPEL
jgi:hypothetical protein